MMFRYLYDFFNIIWNITDIEIPLININLNILIISLMALNLAIIIFVKLVFNTSVASGFVKTTNSDTGEVKRKFVIGKRSR